MRLKEKKKILIPVITLLAVVVVILLLMSKLSNDYLSSSLSETKNGAVEVKKPVINDDEISYSFKLPNDNSSITYKIKIKNQGDYDNLLKSLKLLDKKSIGYKVKGFDDKKIKPGETKIITITFYPKDGGSDDTIDLDIKIDTSSSNNNKNNGSDKNNNKNNNNKNNNNKNNNNKNNNKNNNNNNKNNNTTDDTKNNETKNDTTQNNNVNNNTNNNSSNNSSNNNKNNNNNNNNNNNQNNNSTTNPNKPGSDTKNDNDKNQDVKKYYVIYKTDSVITGEYVTEGGKVNPPIVQTITFKYWSLKEDGEEFDLNTPVTSNMTLYAVYDKNVYTVTFMDGNDVYKTFENQNYGDIISLNNPEKIGYTFKYWSLKENGDKYSPLKVTGNMTLYAVYEIKKCNVTYIVDGIKTKIETYDYGTVLNPEEPIKEGYTFKYWSLTDGGEEYSIITLTDDITLYAVFKINTYTVSFIDDDKNVKDLTIEYNNKINQNDVPTVSKEGYVFTGWSLNKTDLFDFNTPVKENIKLYSTYKKIKNGVSFNDDNRITVKDVDYGDAVEKLDPQGKTGYTFKYWSLDKQTEFDFTTSIKSAVTLYAVYEANKYIISYDNDGEILSETKEVTYDQKYGALKEVSKEGYTFDGWYTEKTGGVKITEDSVVDILSNTTLYARYNINTYKVTYDYKTNGGKSVSTKVAEVDYNSQIDLSVTAEKDDYEFVGWNTEKDAKEGLTNLQMQTSNVTLYAIYRSDVNIEFYANNNTLTLNEVVVSGEDKIISSCTLYNNDESCTISVPTISSEVTPNVIGFTVSKSDKEKIINSNDTINVTKTGYEGKTKFYAQTSSSKKTYTVTYEKDETIESTSKESDSCVINETYNGEVQESSCTVSLPTIEEKYGYKNGKWYDLENSYNEEDEYEISEDKTIYAKGEKREYTVTYKDGETVYDTRKVLYKDTLENTVSNPTKEQYTFMYWSLEKEGEEYDFNTPVTKDVTLYAVYEIKKCNVVYIVDGVQIKTEKYEYGTVLTPEEPTKEGYTFKYWSLTDGGEEYSPITVTKDMTLYAVFKINTYTVTFMQDANRLSSVVVDYNSIILSENIPETQKNGYTFKCWSLDKQTEFDLNTPIKQDTTLYTVYEANKYIVSYDNDGEILSETKEVTYDQKYGTLKEVSKEGYTFDGWYTEKTGGVKITEDSVVDILSNTTLYARYNINTYKVTYDYKTNGGKSVSTKVAEVDYNSQIDLSVTAEKDDYEFVGWNTEKDAKEGLTNLQMQTSNVTLYAIYRSDVNIEFYANNNTLTLNEVVVSGEDKIISSCTLYNNDESCTISVPTISSEVTPNVIGFTVSKSDKEKIINSNDTINVTKTGYEGKTKFYAQTSSSKKTYTVTYEKDETIESTSKESDSCVINETYNGEVQESSCTVSLPTIEEKYGYKNGKWYDLENSYNEEDEYEISEDKTIYAKGEKREYTVTYKDGETVYDIRKVLYKDTLENTVSNPTKEQYTFKYWSLEENGEEYDFNTPVTKDITLYAVYQIKSYSVIYVIDGVSSQEETYEYGTVLTPEEPTKEGYTFKYWSLTDGGEEYSPITVISDMTLYAVFKINTYTVSFIDDDKNVKDLTIEYNNKINQNDLPTVSKEGYTFTGWSLNKTDLFDFNTPVKENIKLYSKYKKIQNGVTFNDDNRITVKDVDYGDTVEKLDSKGKTGYTFKYWSLDKKTEFDFTTSIKSAVTLYAVYEANKYIISYDNDGEILSETKEVTYDQKYGTLKEVSKEGYTFDGWYTSKTDGVKIKEDSVVDILSNTTLYARYNINTYTLTVNTNNGVDNKVYNLKYKETKQIDNPEKTGYTFVNWSVVGVSSSISGNIFTMGSEDAVIIANYNPNVYTITLDNKGADESGTTSVYEKYNDGIYSSIDCQNKITNITVPSKIGYTFKGYYESETSTSPIINSSGVIQMSTTKYLANTTLIAKWEVNTYTLTVNTNNGEASKTYNLSYKETKTIPNPEKEGYTFTGWTLNGQGSTFNQSVFTMGYEDATLSAEYTVNTYQVKYDGNGATGTMPNSTYTYGLSYNLTSNTYQKTGYTFVGWNTDKTKTEALYLDGASVKNLTSVNNNVVTLYAIWKVNTYSLSINPNTGVWNTKTDIQKFNLNYGETKEIANPTKEGYSFKSWTLEGAGSLLNQTTFTMGYENASLVANYEPNVYTITLNSSSATTQGTSMIYQKYNTGIYLDSALTTSMTTSSNNINIPSKTGYIFGGYYTKENGSGTMIINENGYITSSITNTTYKNNVTLYAKWTRLTASMISYTDTYNMGCSNVQCAIDKIKNILDN